MITNRLALESETDDIWKSNLEKLLKEIPEELPLGFYECPSPYKKLISPEALKWCAETGRFLFLKDTSCDTHNIKMKLANTATLLETLKLGVTGYSGVMANFHPELYVWLMNYGAEKPEEAESLISFLSIASFIEKQLYPVNAKYYLMLEGVLTNYHCRSKNHYEFTATNRLEVEQLHRLTQAMSKSYIN